MSLSDSFPVEIRQPASTVTVNFCTYVDGYGFAMRTVPIPASDPGMFLEWLEHVGSRCEHSTPAIWVFQGFFPTQRRKNELFIHVSFNMHEVSMIMSNPKLIRVKGSAEAVKLLPLDPVTGDARLSVVEFNDWVAHFYKGTQRQDFSGVGSDDWSAFEDMLQQAADDNTQEGENG